MRPHPRDVMGFLTTLPHPPYTVMGVNSDDLWLETLVCHVDCVVLQNRPIK